MDRRDQQVKRLLFFCDLELDDVDEELIQTEGLFRLLQELAVGDGRILIDEMPVQLLDSAASLLYHQQEKLRTFGKCIRSLNGFSSCLYDVELPNMRKLDVSWDTQGTSKGGGLFEDGQLAEAGGSQNRYLC
jgi:hypothetical protein